MSDSEDLADDDPLIGKTIAGCRIERKLGGGGMGAVYYAIQTTLDAPVAFKIIRPEVRQDPHLVAFFEREAREVAKLRGKTARVVQIYEFGWDDKAKLYFITMEYVSTSLERHLRAKGRLDEREAARFIKQAADGLEAARKVHIVHRDIKPDNILLTDDGEVKLTDFGLAKNTTATGMSLTQGKTLGTPAYMSPEQAQGDVVDHRTDVYSLGATLYALVTGDTPYKADSAIAMAMKHIQAPVPDACAQGFAVSEGLNEIIKRSMAKSPDGRFTTAGEMAKALDDFLSGAPTLNLAKPKPELAQTLPDGQGQTIYGVGDSDVLVLEDDAAPSQVATAARTPPRPVTPPPTSETFAPRDLTVTPSPATQAPVGGKSRAPLLVGVLALLLLAAGGIAFALGAFDRTLATPGPGPTPPRAAKVRLSAPDSPQNGATLGAGAVHVEGRITGDVEVEGAWVKVNGTAAQLFRDRYTADLTLADGVHAVELTAGAGRAQLDKLSLAITIDATPPEIQVEGPPEGAPVSAAEVVIVATVRDAHLKACTVRGAAVEVADGRLRAPVPLAEGPNAVEIVATDALGHETRHTVSIVRDSQPPALTLPTPAALVMDRRLRLAGRVRDATPVELRLGAVAIAVGSDGAFAHEATLEVGDNALSVTATDAAGNASTWSAAVRYEPLPEGLAPGAEPGVFVSAIDGAAMVRLEGPDGRVFVDRDEVTVARYARFLTAMGDAAATFRPLGWARQSAEGREGHAVVGVSALDAEAYAAWAGKRLPSVGIWVAAAGGPGRRYPWGDAAPDATRAVFGVEPARARAGGTVAGERPAGASPCGARDLAGHVAEWTADEGEPGTRVVKGGGWSDDAEALAIDAWRSEAASDRMYTVGFRCVLPAPVQAGDGKGR